MNRVRYLGVVLISVIVLSLFQNANYVQRTFGSGWFWNKLLEKIANSLFVPNYASAIFSRGKKAVQKLTP
jgi:hypothetical protein